MRTHQLLIFILLACLSGPAAAFEITGNTPGAKPPGSHTYTPPSGPRQAGDTIGSATAIPGLPFSDTGTTDGYFNDYDEVCPYSGSLSPDVVYSFIPAAGVREIDVDLCYSNYDTKTYIYENTQGNLIACNDDYHFSPPCYTYSSFVGNVAVTPGFTYYIVVDGYGSASGSYQIDVTDATPPYIPGCPAGALHENEPTCSDGYVDHFNGGCNSTPAVWQGLEAVSGGCGTVCGLTCTYVSQGLSYRDTDWFESAGLGGDVVLTCYTSFDYMMVLMYGTDCANLLYVYIIGSAPEPGSLSYPIAVDAPVWEFMAPSSFNGLGAGEYVMEVCGIQGGVVPTREITWGRIKKAFR